MTGRALPGTHRPVPAYKEDRIKINQYMENKKHTTARMQILDPRGTQETKGYPFWFQVASKGT